jgi:phage terminase large subunit
MAGATIKVGKVFKDLHEAYESKKYEGYVLSGGSRCFAKGTLVRMADGTLKPIEEVIAGDRVMSMDGRGYNTVVETHSGMDDLFIVKQKRGIDYIINSRHTLSLKQTRPFEKKYAIAGFRSDEKRYHCRLPYNNEKIHDFELFDFCGRSKRFKRNFTGFKNTGIELPYQDVPINPYYLGLWLGDGTSCRPNEITNIDDEIIGYLDEFAEARGSHLSTRNSKHVLYSSLPGTQVSAKNQITEHNKEFKNLSLVNNKHIPDIYIYNSRSIQLQVLAGLIDSDGYDTRRNTLSITQKNRRILEGVLEICRLSGFFTNGIFQSNAKMKRKDGTVYECDVYQMEINHADFRELNEYIKIPRKRITKDCDRNYFSTSINIERYGYGEYFGFSLDNDPHFLLEDGTVVHNSGKSFAIIQLLLVYAQENAKKRKDVLIARQQYSDLKKTIMKDFFALLMDYGMYKEENHVKSHPQSYKHLNTTFYFSGLDSGGAHGEAHDVVWINEAFEADLDAFRQLNQRLREFFILDYNPCFTEHWIIDTILNRPTVFFHHSTMLDNPFLPDRIIREILAYDPSNPENVKNGTADDFMWQVYGLGIGASPEGVIFKYVNWIDEFPKHLPYWYGADWGFTQDPLAIVQTAIDGMNIYFWERCYEPVDNPTAVSEMMHAIGIERYIPIIADSSDKYVSATKGGVEMVKDLKQMGWNISKVRKTKDKIYWIHKLKEYKIHIVRTSNFKKEQEHYRWRLVNGIQVNQPVDKYNHLWDAALYSLMGNKSRNKKRFWN